MDDPACDSTWEDSGDEDGGDPSAGDADDDVSSTGDADEDGAAGRGARPAGLQPRAAGARNWRAMRDTARYRRHYPGMDERDGGGDTPNLRFYRNETPFQPEGCRIEEFLQNWKDNYEVLEDNHSYIQWLFPLREPGVNWHSRPLTRQEIKAFKSCAEIQERLLQAYELMLGFYGIRLQDRSTGRVCRAHNYAERFRNLNSHSHNNLRLTRILKSLGELGLEHLQPPLVHFFLEETLVRGQLPAVRQSALDYFVFTVRCRHQRRQLLRYAWEHFRPRALFVWAPHDRLKRLPLPHSPPWEAPAQDGAAEGASSAQEDGAVDGASPAQEDGAVDGVSPAQDRAVDGASPAQEDGAVDGVSPAQDGAAEGVSPAQDGAADGLSPAQDRAADGASPAQEDGAADGASPAQDGAADGVSPAQDGTADGVSPAQDGAADGASSAQEDGAVDGTNPASPALDAGVQERDPSGQAGDATPTPTSPKESKKRKLEGGREQAPPEPGPHGVSDVERIALNLEGCALSQDSPGPVGSQDTEESAQPTPEPPGSKGTDEVRKRRKVASAVNSPLRSPKNKNGVPETEGQVGPEPAAPMSPAEEIAPTSPQEP